MFLRYCALIGVALGSLMTSEAIGQAAFEPSDYSPTGEAVIKTIRIESAGRSSRRVVVAVGNRSGEAFNANFACTLFDKAGDPVDAASGSIQGVPPGQEAVGKSISFEGDADAATCRIEFTVPAT
jgi:hypothetical protein